jgi:hypothetical protein
MSGVHRLLIPLLILFGLLAAPFSAQPVAAQAPAAPALGTVIGDVLDDLSIKTGDSISGRVDDMVYDSAGGHIYLTGSFDRLFDGADSSSSCGLARMNLNGTWDTAFPITMGDSCNGGIRLMLHDGYLYIGSDWIGMTIDDPDGDPLTGLIFRINVSTSRIDRSWTPSISGSFLSINRIAALPKSGGGAVILVGASADPYLLQIDSADASTVTPVTGYDNAVQSFIVNGSTVYIGGNFGESADGPARIRRFSWDGSSLTLDSAFTPLVGVPDLAVGNAFVMAADDSYLYFNGASQNSNWRGPWRIALSGSAAGTVDTEWRPQISKAIDFLLIDDQYLYISGELNNPYNSIARFDLREAQPTIDRTFRLETGPTALNMNSALSDSDRIYRMAVLPASGSRPRRIVVGGTFESLNGVYKQGVGIVAVNGSGMPAAPRIAAVTGSSSGPYTVSGSAPAGSEVLVFSGAAQLGSTIADAGGSWSFTTSGKLAPGGHLISAVSRLQHVDGRVLRSDSARSNTRRVAVTTAGSGSGQTFALRPTGGYSFCENPIDGDGSNCLGDILGIDGGASSAYFPPQHRPDLIAADSVNSVTIPGSGVQANSGASLMIRVFDADWPTGELGKVYLNNRFLGYITGSDENWSSTAFDIPDLGLLRSSGNHIRLTPTFYDNPWDNTYTTGIQSIVLLTNGGEGAAGRIQTIEVPEPSGSISTAATTSITSDGLFLMTAGLLDDQGRIVAEQNLTATLSSADSPYSWNAVTLESTSDDYVGWTVRHTLHYWDSTNQIWIPQSSRDKTYTGVELSIEDGQLVATVNPFYMGRNLISGDITFYRDGGELGVVTLDPDGTARLDLGDLANGVYEFSATYGGDDNFYGSDGADSLDTTPPPVEEEEAATQQRCELVPDMAVSPQFITIAPGGTAQVEVALRNLCPDRSYGSADVLLSLSDGLTVVGVPDGWLNLGQRAALQNLVLQPGETVRYLITVSAGAVLPTAPLHISELYVGGQVLKRIDGVFLLPEGTVIGAPAPAEAVPAAPAEPAPAEPSAPELPLTLPNTAAAPGSLAWPLLLSAISLLLLGREAVRRNS